MRENGEWALEGMRKLTEDAARERAWELKGVELRVRYSSKDPCEVFI
jgi:hypothetical protein